MSRELLASSCCVLCGDKGKHPSAEPTRQPLVNAQQVSGFLNSQPELTETHFGLDAGPDSLVMWFMMSIGLIRQDNYLFKVDTVISFCIPGPWPGLAQNNTE